MSRSAPIFKPLGLLRPAGPVIALLLLLLAAACPAKQDQTISHTGTNAERSPGSLAIDVVEYTWIFFNFENHIRIIGRVRNNSAEPYQAVSLQVSLQDEGGGAVASGLAYIYPTYLKPGGEGSFELVAMPKSKGRNLPGGRLVTTAFVH